ncbi:MAG: hypothetical protein WA580_04450 [Acidimicrobiales bacterium]
MDRVEEVKALAKDNSVWRVTTSTAKIIVSQLDEDDHPIVVLPMRDVWMSGVRFRGMKPKVCVSRKRLVVVSHPGLLSRAVWETIDKSLIASVSAYSDRTFDIGLSDGREIKVRGMIGQQRVDVMTERLYSEISSYLNH